MTVLTLDVGNSQIFGGLFVDGQLQLRFRRTSREQISSDEIGLFLCQVIRENHFNPRDVLHIVISSVVPELNHSVSSACIKYFDIRPLMLVAGIKTGLQISIPNPLELGADRIANVVAAMHQYPGHDLVVIDFGTAVTVCVVTAKKTYLGGLIAPGLRLSMRALEQNTARLPSVEINVPQTVIGRTTITNIQSGLYFSAVGMVREVLMRLRSQQQVSEDFKVIGTGGFSRFFLNENLFDYHDPDLVLNGLYRVYELNL